MMLIFFWGERETSTMESGRADDHGTVNQVLVQLAARE